MMDSNGVIGNLGDIPLSALGFKARDILCKQLDKLKVIPSPHGLPRDYRGLAQVAGVGCDDIRNPTLGVISQWSGVQPPPTFQDLVENLGRLDRWDVLNDVETVLQADALNYTLTLRQIAVKQQSIQSTASESNNIVTYDDADLVKIGLPPNQRYDAYLLYADQDEEIARDIVYKLEQQYNLKLCVKDRDIIPGAGFEHEAITYLISDRCNWLIVVLTPNFIDCPAQKFIYNYSVALGLSERRNKIIPCLFKLSSDESVNLKLRKVTYSVLPVNFTRKNPFRSNWDQLSGAVAAPRPSAANNFRAIEPPSAVTIEEIPVDPTTKENTLLFSTKKKVSSLEELPSVSKLTPDRPPRSKDKHSSDVPLQNGSVGFNSQKNSSEISKESCSSNNSTAYLLPSQTTKIHSSPVSKLVNGLKKTTFGKSIKQVLTNSKKNSGKKGKKKKMAEAVPS